jgi:hypothetical protein
MAHVAIVSTAASLVGRFLFEPLELVQNERFDMTL